MTYTVRITEWRRYIPELFCLNQRINDKRTDTNRPFIILSQISDKWSKYEKTEGFRPQSMPRHFTIVSDASPQHRADR
jgi:hypothetical protein